MELQVKGKDRKYSNIMEMAWDWESSPGFKFYHLLL